MFFLAGVDEVGRGCLAGPVVAAAVILDENKPIYGLCDSKKLSPKKRAQLSAEICLKAKSFAIAEASVEEIDQINILQASLLAMKRAVEALSIQPHQIQVDGTFSPEVTMASEAIIGGDGLIDAISAASIIAKVYRDTLMTHFDTVYPGYGFAKHAGYGTAAHIQALQKQGICPLHRKSYAPIRKILACTT